MNKVKIANILLMMLCGASASRAEEISFHGGGEFQCTTTAAKGVSVPTVNISTHKQNVRGLCPGGNKVNGVQRGSVTEKGKLTGLPIRWTEEDGTRIELKDICFDTKADNLSSLAVGGTVIVDPASGDSGSISCHRGCTNTTRNFGEGDYC